MNFYNLYVELCNKINKSPSAVALEIGLSKTAVNGWKTKGTTPTDANFLKIADYFNVSIQYLKGEEKQEIKKPLSENEERLKELYDLTANFSETEMQLIKAYAAGIKASRENR